MALNTVNISITINKDFKEKLDSFVKNQKNKTNKSRSKWLQFAMEKEIDKHDEFDIKKIIENNE